MRYNVTVRTRLPALLLSLLAVLTASSAHAYSEPQIPGTRVGDFTGVTPQNRIGGYQLASLLSEANLELQLGGSTSANGLSITANASGSGLFQQRDPSGFADSVNLYAGFAWDPVNKRDPTGEQVAEMVQQERAAACTGMSEEECRAYLAREDQAAGMVSAGLLCARFPMACALVTATGIPNDQDAGPAGGALIAEGLLSTLFKAGRVAWRALRSSGSLTPRPQLTPPDDALQPAIGAGPPSGGKGSLEQADVIRALRQRGTPEARATEKLIKRGRVKLEISDTRPAGVHPKAEAWTRYGSDRITIHRPSMCRYANPAKTAAGAAAHETRHFLQGVARQPPSKLSEVEAFLWQASADGGARLRQCKEITDFVNDNYTWLDAFGPRQ